MTSWLALLRAVNVGGRKLPMADLRDVAGGLGWARPRTFIQSGNLIFEAHGEKERLEAELEAAIAGRTGLEVPTMIRSAAQWQALIASNPFREAAATAPSRLLLMISKNEVLPTAAAQLAERARSDEKLELAGGALWIVYPEGVGTSKLTPAAIDRACGSPTTGRNFRTALNLLDLLQ